jgi:hypothetical protein
LWICVSRVRCVDLSESGSAASKLRAPAVNLPPPSAGLLFFVTCLRCTDSGVQKNISTIHEGKELARRASKFAKG